MRMFVPSNVMPGYRTVSTEKHMSFETVDMG